MLRARLLLALAIPVLAVALLGGCGSSGKNSKEACVTVVTTEKQYKLAAARMGLKFGQTKYETPLFASIASFRSALAQLAKSSSGQNTEIATNLSEALARQQALLEALRVHDQTQAVADAHGLDEALRQGLAKVERICRKK
jgi:hypothetical protein